MLRAWLPWLVAACGSPLATQPPAPRGDDPSDLAMLFAPRASSGVLAKYLVASIGNDSGEHNPGDSLERTYDFEHDGTIDLATKARWELRPSDGWAHEVATRDGKQLRWVFTLGGEWSDEREGERWIALRFEAAIYSPGEARFSTLLRYDRTTHRWDPPMRAYVALQTTPPPTHPPYRPLAITSDASLRATPMIDDTPLDQLAEPEGFAESKTLEGNTVARLAGGARGWILASEREWDYVAIDPATRPREISLAHGLADSGDPWLCGWIHQDATKR